MDKYYVGYTHDFELRLVRHNEGKSKFTSKGAPWELVYLERYESKIFAIKREKEIKKKKSRKFIESLIEKAGGRPD